MSRNANRTRKYEVSAEAAAAAVECRYGKKHCPNCGTPVYAGQLIAGIERRGMKKAWVHVDCDDPNAGREKWSDRKGRGETDNAVAPVADNKKSATKVEAQDNELRKQVEQLRKQVEELEAKTPRQTEIIINGVKTGTIEGDKHDNFDEVAKLVSLGLPVFLPGPTGSGKSHLANQVATALGYKFGSISCTAGMSESQLNGRMIPVEVDGRWGFVSTTFLDLYENGGVFLFDEMDAADPNVLLLINSAIANGFMSIPSRHKNPEAKMHDDFRPMAAANTFGRGANRLYCGRNPLDEATLDRFRMGTVPVDYCRPLEEKIWSKRCDAPREWLVKIWAIRDAAEKNRLERVISTRAIRDAATLAAAGFDFEYIESKLLGGWREDEVAKVKRAA